MGQIISSGQQNYEGMDGNRPEGLMRLVVVNVVLKVDVSEIKVKVV